MMSGQSARLTHMTIDLGDEQALLERLDVTEGFSTPFTIALDVIASLELDVQPHLGKPAAVKVFEDDKLQRHFHGYVVASEYRKESPVGHHYRLTLRPWTYFLAQNRDIAIYQNKNVVEIIRKVFADAGISDVDYSRLSGSWTARPYCVQYRESDFAFVSRLMEEEGIYYFFHHRADRHVMTLCNAPSSHTASDPAMLVYNPNSISVFAADSDARHSQGRSFLQSWIERVSTQAEGKVTLHDFDFEQSTGPLKGDAHAGPSHPGDREEVYHFPGNFTVEGHGGELSGIMLDAMRADRRMLTGTSQAASLACGTKLKITNHPVGRMNGDYLIVSTYHSIAEESYRSGRNGQAEDSFNIRFEAMPAATRFHTPRRTPRPIVQGLESAIVTGPAGEEIYTDKYGRVKVRFHWDRAGAPGDQTTCWIRVSQTGGLGNIILPRVGHEVLVDFLNGDPDKPIVVGRVFNSTHMPIYPLPANKTRALWRTKRYGNTGKYDDTEKLDTGTPGVNELRFEDLGGHEEVFIHAERDMNTRIRHDETLHVGHNQGIKVGWNRNVKVRNNEMISIGVNKTDDIGQDQNLTVGRNQTDKISGNRETKITGNDQLDVTGKQSVTVTQAVAIESKLSIELKVNGSSILINNMGVTIKAPMVTIEADAMVDVKGPVVMINGKGMLKMNGGITFINT